ncbi:MAG: hypothetical protein ACE5GE_10010 [Phycisphaerae bacterium]
MRFTFRHGSKPKALLALLATCLAGCTAGSAPRGGGGGGGGATPGDSAPPDLAVPVPVQNAPPLIPTETRRVAVQSPCGQVILECESSQPVPIISIQPFNEQFVTLNDGTAIIAGVSLDGIETVQLIGGNSIPGLGATQITYSWTHGGTDRDPASLAPGPEFSTEPNPLVRLGAGFHYLRLTVRNGTEPALSDWSPDNLQANFLELEVEVRSSSSPIIDDPKG